MRVYIRLFVGPLETNHSRELCVNKTLHNVRGVCSDSVACSCKASCQREHAEENFLVKGPNTKLRLVYARP